jgi:hypothetical protein
MPHLEQTYVTVAAGQTDAALGSGQKGDVLARLLVVVATAATSTVSVKDGNGSAISVVPANTPIGAYSLDVGAIAINATTPGWKVTTGAGVSVVAVGKFV